MQELIMVASDIFQDSFFLSGRVLRRRQTLSELNYNFSAPKQSWNPDFMKISGRKKSRVEGIAVAPVLLNPAANIRVP